MKPKLLIRAARQLVTLRGLASPRRGPALSSLAVIEDGALLIVDGKIAAVGPSRRVENLAEARGAREISAAGRVVMPGLIDCHTSLISGPAIFDQSEAAGVEAAAHATTQSVQSSPGPRLQLEAMKILRAAARHGTTTLEAKSGYGFTESAEVKTLRSLAKINRKPIEIFPTLLACRLPPQFATPVEYFAWMRTVVLPHVEHRKFAVFADVVVDSEQGFLPSEAIAWLRAAAAHGLALKLQTHRYHRSDSIAAALAIECSSVDHLNHITRDEIPLLAAGDTVAVLIPAPVFHTGRLPFPPARDLVERGVPIALASGFDHNESPIYSMQTVIGLACRHLGLTPAEALSAATFNAACALKAQHRLGSLEYGKEADILLLNVPDYRAIPHYFGANLVAMTIKAGEVVSKHGEVKPLEG